jgi:hypothetical protein
MAYVVLHVSTIFIFLFDIFLIVLKSNTGGAFGFSRLLDKFPNGLFWFVFNPFDSV